MIFYTTRQTCSSCIYIAKDEIVHGEINAYIGQEVDEDEKKTAELQSALEAGLLCIIV